MVPKIAVEAAATKVGDSLIYSRSDTPKDKQMRYLITWDELTDLVYEMADLLDPWLQTSSEELEDFRIAVKHQYTTDEREDRELCPVTFEALQYELNLSKDLRDLIYACIHAFETGYITGSNYDLVHLRKLSHNEPVDIG